MNQHFIERSRCPCCEALPGAEIYRSAFAESCLRDYLLSFYRVQGNPDLRYLQDQDYLLLRCPECGLVWQKEIPGKNLMLDIYEKWIDPAIVFERIERQRELGYFSCLSAEVLRACRLFKRSPLDLTFLDYSMGWGHWCLAAQGFGCQVHGTEFSPSRVAYAKAHGVQVVDADNLEPQRYDFINTEQVFEHLPEPLPVLRRLRQALAPGGFLRIGVPDGDDIARSLRHADWSIPRGRPGSLIAVAPLEHINCFTTACLVQMARYCGLRPIPEPPNGSWVFDPVGVKGLLKASLRPLWRTIHPTPLQNNLALFFQTVDDQKQEHGS